MDQAVSTQARVLFLALACGAFLAFAPGLPGQTSRNIPQVTGEVKMEGGGGLDRLTVELAVQGQAVARTAVRLDGSFEFRDVAEGTYEARVVNLSGTILSRAAVSIGASGKSLSLEVPSTPKSEPVSGVVPLRQLIPAKARREFVRAEKAFQKGKLDESIRRLETAIRIHPAYLEAHNNLGARMMWKKDYERAAAEFLVATQLDAASASGHANLALALTALKRYQDAASSARRALELNPDYLPARYALGLTDAALNICTAAAAENLKLAAGQYPHARLAAARVLACRGETAEAEAQLRAYRDARPGMEKRAPAARLSSEFAGASSH